MVLICGQRTVQSPLGSHLNSALKLYMSQNICWLCTQEGLILFVCFMKFPEIYFYCDYYYLWSTEGVSTDGKMAQILFISKFFSSVNCQLLVVLWLQELWRHTGFNLLDIFGRSAFNDYVVNLPFNFHGRFSTLKIYLQSFFNINSHVTVESWARCRRTL